MSTIEKKRSVGRPPGRKYTREVQVYLSPEEENAFRTLASKQRKTMSSFARQILLAEVARHRQREEFEAALNALTPEEIEEINREYLEAGL